MDTHTTLPGKKSSAIDDARKTIKLLYSYFSPTPFQLVVFVIVVSLAVTFFIR